MAAEIEIRPLRPDDDRGAFSCGRPDLDRFFQHYAGQNQFRLHLAVTYVATAPERLLGFATVSVGSLERKPCLPHGSGDVCRPIPSPSCGWRDSGWISAPRVSAWGARCSATS